MQWKTFSNTDDRTSAIYKLFTDNKWSKIPSRELASTFDYAYDAAEKAFPPSLFEGNIQVEIHPAYSEPSNTSEAPDKLVGFYTLTLHISDRTNIPKMIDVDWTDEDLAA